MVRYLFVIETQEPDQRDGHMQKNCSIYATSTVPCATTSRTRTLLCSMILASAEAVFHPPIDS